MTKPLPLPITDPALAMRLWIEFDEANQTANCIGVINVDGYFKRKEAWEAYVAANNPTK